MALVVRCRSDIEDLRWTRWRFTLGEVEGWPVSESWSGSGGQLTSGHNERLRRRYSSRQSGRSQWTDPRRRWTVGGIVVWLHLIIVAAVWLFDLIHPASPMHRATRWRQVCLSWADASTSSQVNQLNPILWMSLFTISLQFILGLPGLLLNPGTSHCSACFGIRTSSILVTWPSHRNLLSRITFSRSVCPVLFRTSPFVQQMFIQ